MFAQSSVEEQAKRKKIVSSLVPSMAELYARQHLPADRGASVTACVGTAVGCGGYSYLLLSHQSLRCLKKTVRNTQELGEEQ